MRNSLLLAGMALALMLPSVTVAQSDDALSAYERKDVAEITAMAEQGDVRAQYIMGNIYYHGKLVAQDFATAASWFRKAAEQGKAASQYSLGVAYHQGKGVAQDYTGAVSWYQKAADQGYAEAQTNLGAMYLNGEGVPQNYAAAIALFRKAAHQGSLNGQYNLSLVNYYGQGTPKNYVEAYKWIILSLANAQGTERTKSIGFRDLIAKKLTDAQIAEAQRLASIWKTEK